MTSSECNWTDFRTLPDCIEVDFHRSESGRRKVPYWEAMSEVYSDALESIERAYELGLKYVLMTHGSSTSRPGHTTARSQIRGLVRSPEATPYVNRRECIQHNSVFVVALKHNPAAAVRTPQCPYCGETEVEDRHSVEGAGYFRCRRGDCRQVFNWFTRAKRVQEAKRP